MNSHDVAVPERDASADDGQGQRRVGDRALARAVLAGLDAADVRWCLLRPGADGATPADDVDVLVAAADLPRAVQAIQAHGLVRLRSYGRGTHSFFLGFDQTANSWVEFDLVTEIAFGRYAEVRTAAASECLARRVRRDGVWTLAPEDEFWALLLHCLLDKGALPDHHLRRLTQLRGAASRPSPLADELPAAVDLTPIDQRRGDPRSALMAQRGPLLAAWWRAHPAAAARRRVASAALRLVERPLQAWSRRGVSVALLGPDGAGKSTLATGIESSFYFPVRRVYMGLWPTSELPRGAVAGMLRIVLRPTVVWRRYLASVGHRARGRLVVFDRYVYDALLPPRGSLVWLKRPYFQFLSRLCPAPDLVVLLDVPGPVMHLRCGEYDAEHLEAQRAEYQRLSARIPRLLRVDADRPSEVVLADVLGQIWQHYVRRAAR